MSARASADPVDCLFAHHKARYRDGCNSDEDRIDSGCWLLANGVLFDQGEFILPDGELPR